jgi:hypothetical protein
MRKHSKSMASRWPREPGDRSNTPSQISHSLCNSKAFQFAANTLLQRLISRVI